MNEGLESWKITDFNLENRQIEIGKLGVVKIIRSDDGVLTLVGDANYGILNQEKTTAADFAKVDSILGFVLDIGIRKEKMLARGHGFYFGMPLIHPQSQKAVSQTDFDEGLFEKIGNFINTKYQSGNKEEETEAIRLQLLFDTYNDARLLFPNFYAESYLSLLRIIEAISLVEHSHNIATYIATLSSKLNEEIYSKIIALKAYEQRIQTAKDLFNELLQKANTSGWSCKGDMRELDDQAKFIFACFYSAYQYRNKFVHLGFPFPDIVKDSTGLKEGSGTAYLHPALGISWQKIYRPEGLEDGDLIDIHQAVPDADEAQKFKEKYFHLLPTWHFLKCLTREALVSKIV